MPKPIETRQDIEFLVNEFYKKVQKDEVIGYIFNEVVQLSWETHIPVMYNFWETILLGETVSYKGNPMLVHLDLNKKEPLTKTHFDRWLALFTATINEYFTGEKADEAKKRAQSMAQLIMYKIEQSKDKNFIQ